MKATKATLLTFYREGTVKHPTGDQIHTIMTGNLKPLSPGQLSFSYMAVATGLVSPVSTGPLFSRKKENSLINESTEGADASVHVHV